MRMFETLKPNTTLEEEFLTYVLGWMIEIVSHYYSDLILLSGVVNSPHQP